MAVLTPRQNAVLWSLKHFSHRLTRQQLKTLRGQVLAGDPDGADRGLRKILTGGRHYASKSSD